MSWADRAKQALRAGQTVRIRPRGHSMKPKVCDGDLVTLEPCRSEELEVGATAIYGRATKVERG